MAAMIALDDDNARALILGSLGREHSPDDARRILDAGDSAVVLASLRRSIAGGEHALMDMHPLHPWRGAIALERARLLAVVAQLASEAQR